MADKEERAEGLESHVAKGWAEGDHASDRDRDNDHLRSDDRVGLASKGVTPTQRVALPTDSAARKALPITSGVLDYFPDALLEVAHCSKVGNDQHNPGQPLHWAKEKSTDHADCIVRHLMQRGTTDTDGVRHSAKVAWRALALLQTELDAERQSLPPHIHAYKIPAEELEHLKPGPIYPYRNYSVPVQAVPHRETYLYNDYGQELEHNYGKGSAWNND